MKSFLVFTFGGAVLGFVGFLLLMLMVGELSETGVVFIAAICGFFSAKFGAIAWLILAAFGALCGHRARARRTCADHYRRHARSVACLSHENVRLSLALRGEGDEAGGTDPRASEDGPQTW